MDEINGAGKGVFGVEVVFGVVLLECVNLAEAPADGRLISDCRRLVGLLSAGQLLIDALRSL